nr:hypothetical protein [Tanacetum cinerariifolium]
MWLVAAGDDNEEGGRLWLAAKVVEVRWGDGEGADGGGGGGGDDDVVVPAVVWTNGGVAAVGGGYGGEAARGKITVVTLVEEQMSPWHGNLPRLPIRSNIVRLATTSIVISPYHNDSYIIQAYEAIPPPQAIIALSAVLPLSPVLSLPPMFDSQDFFSSERISPPKDTKTHPFQYLHLHQMPPKRTSTSAAPAMNQAAIRQLINDRVAAALKA